MVTNVGIPAQSEDDEQDGPGWLSTWFKKDPVRAVAVALIVVQLVWRVDIASRGYLAQDDFALSARAAAADLTPDFLLTVYANHIAPGVMLVYWLLSRATGLAYWPYLLLLTAGQAALSVAFYRLCRQLFRPSWGLLIPLWVLLFSPLTFEVTSYALTGLLILPMQLAMVLAIGAQVKYVRTRRKRHLVTLALSLLFGLLFFEKSLLIFPLVLLVTMCLFVKGGPLRSVGRALRQYWASWLVLGTLSLVYLGIYLTRGDSALRKPESVGEVVTYLKAMIGHTLIPSLLGGPWNWFYVGDGAPLVAPPEVARWLSWAVLLAVIVVTVLRRPSAVRAWVLLALYASLVTSLFGATRLGSVLGPLAGLAPRYVGDVAVVAAICVGAAVLGLGERAPVREWSWSGSLREPGAIVTGIVLFVALAIGTAWSGARFGDGWAMKQGRDYLRTAQAELAEAPPGTVFFDQPVPEAVMTAVFFWPDNLQSHFFRPMDLQPTFVAEAENLSVFDASGRIRPATVEGPRIQPGPDGDCGYKVTGLRTVRMPLTGPAFEWEWAVRVGYLSSGDSAATLRLGNGTHRFQIRRGLHEVYFRMVGGGTSVELTIADPAVTVCTNAIAVGNLVPRQ